MRNILLAALCAVGVGGAHAADWSTFVGSNPFFPNRLAPHGLAVDADGAVAVQAYNRLAWSGQIEFVHEYALDAAGGFPWIWGLVGRNGNVDFAPRGVGLANGHRLMRVERDDGMSHYDEIGGAFPGSSQPAWQHPEPRVDGQVVDAIADGAGGAYALRALDAGAGVEVVALDPGGSVRWRSTAQPCGVGVDPANLMLDLVPTGLWLPSPTLSVGGSCAAAFGAPSAFAQRFAADTGATGVPEWIVVPPGYVLERLAFSPTHALVAVLDTPWSMREAWRIAAPGDPTALPPEPLADVAQVDALVASGGDDLVVAGLDASGAPVVVPLAPRIGPFPTLRLDALSAYAGGGWSIAVDANGAILASRAEPAGSANLLRLVGLDATGQKIEWTSTVADVLPDAVAQVVAPRDGQAGFVVAVDVQQPDGTVGVQIERVGSAP